MFWPILKDRLPWDGACFSNNPPPLSPTSQLPKLRSWTPIVSNPSPLTVYQVPTVGRGRMLGCRLWDKLNGQIGHHPFPRRFLYSANALEFFLMSQPPGVEVVFSLNWITWPLVFDLEGVVFVFRGFGCPNVFAQMSSKHSLAPSSSCRRWFAGDAILSFSTQSGKISQNAKHICGFFGTSEEVAKGVFNSI